MAKVGDRVAKVVCKRCGTPHVYRRTRTEGDGSPAPTGGGTRGMTGLRRRRRPTPPPPAPPPVFDPSKPPRTYSPRELFSAGERVTHPSFGLGVVRGTPGPGRVEIVFPLPAGPRVMACNKELSTLVRPIAVAAVPIADRPPGK